VAGRWLLVAGLVALVAPVSVFASVSSSAPPAVPTVLPHLPTREDTRLDTRLDRLGDAFDGWTAIYVEDLESGTYAGWNSDARFPAASTVKIGVIAEGIRRFGFGPGSPIDSDLRAIGTWSSNKAANRIFRLVGGVGPTEAALRRLGMFSSTYPGLYRVKASASADAPDPPETFHTRVTTAHDLARALFRLQAASAGQRWAIRDTGLRAAGARAALGYLGLADPAPSLLAFPPGSRHAEKDGWLDDTRASAAIVYVRGHAKIVVVLTYRPKISLTQAGALGVAASRLAFASG